MKTMDDVALEHAELYRMGKLGSTMDGLEILELPVSTRPDFNIAANRYLAALSVIVTLQDKIAKLQKQLENGNDN